MKLTGSPWLASTVAPRLGRIKRPKPVDAPRPKGNQRRALTDEEVYEVFKEYGRGRSCRQIAAKYGVSHITIWKILHRKSYKYLPLVPLEVPENVET